MLPIIWFVLISVTAIVVWRCYIHDRNKADLEKRDRDRYAAYMRFRHLEEMYRQQGSDNPSRDAYYHTHGIKDKDERNGKPENQNPQK